MGGNIDCYLDCSSFYSYMALTYLLKNSDKLASHDITVNFIPVFLGGINHGSGNKPPWTLPAKAAYGIFDAERAKRYHGLEKVEAPDFFPPVTLLPQRALTFIKHTHPASTFIQTWEHLFTLLWTPPQLNITIPESLHHALTTTNLFTPDEITAILQAATEKEWKDKLLENTKKVLDQGAFGAPWFWVRNEEGREEAFFGSDRFHFMWEFLGIPWKDIEILPPPKRKQEGKAKL